MAFNPNEARDAMGKWTAGYNSDMSNALKNAAKDKPPIDIPEADAKKIQAIAHGDYTARFQDGQPMFLTQKNGKWAAIYRQEYSIVGGETIHNGNMITGNFQPQGKTTDGSTWEVAETFVSENGARTWIAAYNKRHKSNKTL
jgi:hypothetical protein